MILIINSVVKRKPWISYEEGKDDELLGRIQRRLGKSKDEVVAWIRSLG